jgi:hypothetical protein
MQKTKLDQKQDHEKQLLGDEWESIISSTGSTYYYNRRTGKTTWNRAEAMVSSRNTKWNGEKQKWICMFDETSSKHYYCCEETQETSWVMPTGPKIIIVPNPKEKERRRREEAKIETLRGDLARAEAQLRAMKERIRLGAAHEKDVSDNNSKFSNGLSTELLHFLGKAKLSKFVARLQSAGAAEVEDLMSMSDSDLEKIGLKEIEIIRLKKHLGKFDSDEPSQMAFEVKRAALSGDYERAAFLSKRILNMRLDVGRRQSFEEEKHELQEFLSNSKLRKYSKVFELQGIIGIDDLAVTKPEELISFGLRRLEVKHLLREFNRFCLRKGRKLVSRETSPRGEIAPNIKMSSAHTASLHDVLVSAGLNHMEETLRDYGAIEPDDLWELDSDDLWHIGFGEEDAKKLRRQRIRNKMSSRSPRLRPASEAFPLTHPKKSDDHVGGNHETNTQSSKSKLFMSGMFPAI